MDNTITLDKDLKIQQELFYELLDIDQNSELFEEQLQILEGITCQKDGNQEQITGK